MRASLETRALIKRIGGDWNQRNDIEVEGVTYDVYSRSFPGGSIDLLVVEQTTHVRVNWDDLDEPWTYEFESYAEDPDVQKLVYEITR